MLYYFDKNWNHFINFIKEYREQFSNFAFQKVACPVEWPNRCILEVLLACRHTFVAQNHWASVRLHHWYILMYIYYILYIFTYILWQPLKFTLAVGNCWGYAEANSIILWRWLFPSKIYIQFTIFNTYILTKLLFTSKRYCTMLMGTTLLQDRKNEMRRKKDWL